MESPSSLLSPSHTPTSSEKLADIAARVLRELRLSDPDRDDEEFPLQELDDFYSSLRPDDDVTDNDGDDVTDDDDDEFEFCNPSGDHNCASPVSADDIFSNGQIKPLYYPLFDTSLLNQYDAVSDSKQGQRIPLRKLMTEESAAAAASCSSSEADDLDGVPHETYCVWVPHDSKSDKNGNIDDVATMKKKCKSTGSSNNSKRWRIRDLVQYRSNSDGKDKFVFLTQHPRRGGGAHHYGGGGGGGGDVNNQKQPIPADKKKKTYLPYRQDLVGFFSTPTSLNRTIKPF